MNKIISLILPVYRNEESIPELLSVLEDLNASLGKTLEVVFVVDGSPDQSYVILRDSQENASFPTQLILLSLNFGSFAAIRAGLEAGTGEYFAVMAADLQEPPSLIIEEARNSFNRLHADPYVSDAIADEYLGTFIENSVKGFTDLVLVPDDDQPPGAFFAGDLISKQNSPIRLASGSIVLTAASTTRKGWHLKLMSEISLYFQKQGILLAYMKTQSTNRAVIHNCEKLGWKYGRCTHIFTIHC